MILITPTIVTNNDPVKGSSKMLEEVENSKRQWQEMEDIYPNDPPAKLSPEKGGLTEAEQAERGNLNG